MKKTLTVNLGGIVFHIDEDAYNLLDKYLDNLRSHFKKQEEKEEIMNDIEMRISELFTEQTDRGFQVITIEFVEQIIQRVGKPEEIFDNDYISDENTQQASQTEEKKEKQEKTEDTTSHKKRLMRDPDEKMIGGVAGGLAAYFSVDVTVVRLALILLLFFFAKVVLPIYLVLWLVVPLARTAMDKLQMRGESVNLENIGKTVTEGFEGSQEKEQGRGDNRTGFQKLADGLVAVIGFVLKGLGILLAILLLPILAFVLFILLIVTIALVFGGMGALFGLMPFIGNNLEFMQEIPTYLTVINNISGILVLGIPLVALIYLLCGNWFKLPPMSTTAKWVLLGIWVIALITSIYCVSQIGWGEIREHIHWMPNIIHSRIINTLL